MKALTSNVDYYVCVRARVFVTNEDTICIMMTWV